MYFVPRLLADRARLVKEAMTAKKVALRCAGAFLAIQASIGIIAICPRGDSIAVSKTAMKRASTTPLVLAGSMLGEDVDEWLPRTRQREAVDALVGLGRLADAKALVEQWCVDDRALLENVPSVRAALHHERVD